MPALVRRNGNALHVFFNGTFHNLSNGTIMTKMDDLGTFALHDASHDIDGCVMAIKQTGRGNDPDFMGGRIWHTTNLAISNW
jgi:hypothetical protein